MNTVEQLQLIARTVAAQLDLRHLRLGTIDDTYDPTVTYPDPFPDPKVTFDGEDTLTTEKARLGGYVPAPGERVVLAPLGVDWVILGPVGGDRHQGFYRDGTADGVEIGGGYRLSNEGGTISSATNLVTADGDTIGVDNPPRVKVYQSAAVSLGSGSADLLDWDSNYTTAFEVGGTWHDHTTNPHLFTVPIPGTYDVAWSMTWAANNTGVRIADLKLNGTTIASRIEPTPTALFACAVTGFVPGLELAEGDQLSVEWLQTSGGSLALVTGAANTYFYACRRSVTA